MAYYDELEICNPLGSSAKKHKLGIVFFSVANMNPKRRSTFKAIFLSTITKVSIVEAHGIDAILKPFVDDLNVLGTTGITVTVNGEAKVYHGALLAFLADNLASHSIGGFKESMSFAKRFCRTCLTDKNDSYDHFTEEEFQLRSPSEHIRQCEEVLNDQTKSIEYGVNRNSILNDVIGFSVITGLPHDIMHDMLEGVANYETRLFLQHCFASRYITLEQINDRLLNFDYGYSVSAKPPLLNNRCFQENLKIKMSAAEMMTLIHILPIIVGDKIPSDDLNYQCFLVLLQIFKICIAPAVTDRTIPYLRVLIEEHHTLFRQVYPNQSFIPKLHYMVHYPMQILRHGPLVRSWTMRHEGKLNFFKQAAHSGNFKNITMTLAKHHQLWLAYHLETESLLAQEFNFGPIVRRGKLSDETEDIQRELLCSYDGDATVIKFKWLKLNSIKYMSNNCFIVLNLVDNEPQFGKVLEILQISNKNLFLSVSVYNCLSYDSHILCYTVAESSSVQVISVNSLKYPSVLHSYKNKENELLLCITHYLC